MRETPKKIRADPQYQVARKVPSDSPDHFGYPSENVINMKQPNRLSIIEWSPSEIIQNGHYLEAIEIKY